MTLAYVFLEDGTFLNAEIIRQGYGFAYTRFQFRRLLQLVTTCIENNGGGDE